MLIMNPVSALPKAPVRLAHGLTPPALDDSVHTVRCLQQLRSKDRNIEKYIYLTQLKDAEPNMFYKLCVAHMAVSDHRSHYFRIGGFLMVFCRNLHP